MRTVSATPSLRELSHLGSLASALAQQRELILLHGSRGGGRLVGWSVRPLGPATRASTRSRTASPWRAAAAGLEVWRQLAPHIGPPDLGHVALAIEQPRIVPGEEEAQVVHVPLEEELRAIEAVAVCRHDTDPSGTRDSRAVV